MELLFKSPHGLGWCGLKAAASHRFYVHATLSRDLYLKHSREELNRVWSYFLRIKNFICDWSQSGSSGSFRLLVINPHGGAR